MPSGRDIDAGWLISAFGGILLVVAQFWLRAPELLAVCAAVAVAVFFTAHLVESRFRLLLWADALGPEGSGASTYVDAVEANAATLAAGLSRGELACREG